MSIEVVKPGALSTFQDLGRSGYQHLGIPVNGVMDERAHRLANALVGNAPSHATLELTLMGPTLKFHRGAVIAICGADFNCRLNGQAGLAGQALPLDEAVVVAAGAELVFGACREGVRAYLAVRGGFDFEPVMGSASTYTRGGYGGHAGRPLKKGDVLALHTRGLRYPAGHCLDDVFDAQVLATADAPIRVTRGREWHYFSARAQQAFEQEPYRLAPQSDRMGYRLQGAQLELSAPYEAVSEAVGFGAIQIPADGQPIILMADRQTTGGYPKIGQVCAVDLPRLAQKMPGDTVRFKLVDLDTAQGLVLAQERSFAVLEGLGRG